jgi:signal transduction histidine kinase
VLAIVTAVLAVVAAGLAVAVWRLRHEAAEARQALGGHAGQPLAVEIRHALRGRVPRDELSAALFSRESLLEAVPVPVLVVDQDGRVARANGRARAALGELRLGRPIAEVASALGEAVDGVLRGPPLARVEIGPVGDGRTYAADVRSHPGSDDGRAAVVVLEDVSAAVDFREARRLFSAAVSHELRTPLQRIRGVAETLGLPLDEEARAELVREVEVEIDRMRGLIDEMLLLAALDRGDAPTPAGEADAGEVARRVVSERRPRAEAAGMQLGVRAARDLRVPISEGLLEVVVGNVVDNAVRHAGRPATVDIEVSGRAGGVELAVRDTGVGIPSEQLPHVLERFFRGDASRSTPGTGLGLALVKHIVNAHGGAVSVESRPGEGTEVRIALPEA